MGIVQSIYCSIMGYTPIVNKICHICKKNAEVHIAREFDGKVSYYFCTWECYRKYVDERKAVEKLKVEEEERKKDKVYERKAVEKLEEERKIKKVNVETPLVQFP
jgi:YHS domain-containing protein